MFAYHNDPEKTKRAYNVRGWSTLGDVGYLDAEGFLYLTDRKSHMIISGGVNIYPQETEDVLITHDDVADVAVFGVPNEEMGEEVKAVVQPHDMARAGKALEAELIFILPKAPVADQMPAQHRLRSRIAAHANGKAGEAALARQILAEDSSEGVGVALILRSALLRASRRMSTMASWFETALSRLLTMRRCSHDRDDHPPRHPPSLHDPLALR